MDWIDKIFELLQNKDYLSVLIFITIMTLANYKKILEAVSDYKYRRVKHLNRLLESENIDPITKEILIDQRNNALFHSATGINCEKHFREELLKKHKEANGSFTLKHIRWAMLYIDRKRVAIKIGWFEYFGAIVNSLGAFFFVMLFILLMSLPFKSETFQMQTLVWSWGLALLSYLAAFFFFFQVVVLLMSIKMLKPVLNK